MYLHGILDIVTSWTGTKVREGVAAYRTKQKDFQSRYKALLAAPPKAGDLTGKKHYDGLLAESREIISKMAWIDGQLNAIARVTEIPKFRTGITFGTLEFLPVAVIPVAVVSVIAGVTYLIGKMIDKTDAYLRAVKGLPPSKETGGLFGEASRLVWPIALVAGLFVFGPQLMRGKRR